jgi:hypothetical protein
MTPGSQRCSTTARRWTSTVGGVSPVSVTATPSISAPRTALLSAAQVMGTVRERTLPAINSALDLLRRRLLHDTDG